ncbi:MAG: hypothetical protein ACPGN3_12215 [Opitutales bacterium]
MSLSEPRAKGNQEHAKRVHLALYAGLSGLSYAWRLKGWKSLEFDIQIVGVSGVFRWSSANGVSTREDRETPCACLYFRSTVAFLEFVDHGRLTFAFKGNPIRWGSLLRFLIGAARLQMLMRGGDIGALSSRGMLIDHGQASLWTAIKGLAVSDHSHKAQLSLYVGKSAGFFLEGSPRQPLVGLKVRESGNLEVLDSNGLEGASLSAKIVFKDPGTLYDAVHHISPNLQMVGEGNVEVSGLVPLADLVGACLDEMDYLLNPVA